MLRRSPRAVLLGTAAAVVALATAGSVADVLLSLRRQDEAFGRVRTVVVAARDLTLGHRVAAADLATRDLRGDAGEDALSLPDAALGRTVTVPLLHGAVVTSRHLASRRRDGRDGIVPRGHRAMRVTVEGGVEPRPGDPVDLYATFDPQIVGAGGDVEPTLTVARAVPVLAAESADSTGGGGRTVAVTVLVTAQQAPRLAFATAAGTLALAVAPPEAAARSSLPARRPLPSAR
jgi:Flp pilus assembly protein CpaB